MTQPDEPLLTVDQAYCAAFHFIRQYYEREPIVPFLVLLQSMYPWTEGGDPRLTSDPATWHDWMSSVQAALSAKELPTLRGLPEAR